MKQDNVEGGWQIKISEGNLEAEQVVVTMAHWIGELLERLGMKLPLFAQRVCHLH
ncbi:hypothetical protein [Salinicola endophyticus]|uniref:hypothetical protein n=1 Tax=Salinicola endophyticus TaxID=1949083 RepID=UPI0013005379|nr:hypothetical protein [Salinicola endophyticus]